MIQDTDENIQRKPHEQFCLRLLSWSSEAMMYLYTLVLGVQQCPGLQARGPLGNVPS